MTKKDKTERAIVLLKDVRESMKAERILKAKDYDVKIVAPPPEVRIGCDLAIEINIVDSFGVQNTLKNNRINPINVVPLSNMQLKPLEIVKETDLGEYLMIKAGHMKLTFNKNSGEIVNVSGGGCPDIPFLALSMVGKTIESTKRPDELGYTLCAYMLEKAYERALQLRKEKQPC
ncbi:MAG: DUF3343 domain-containing protein [Candidatus Bathyarchaeota archaeon]|nr:DUF3343 domain-containing protein [Candidatus Bathyarchaeota archaeon]